MKLDGVFGDLEQLYDFQTIGYDSHFVFSKRDQNFVQTGFHRLKHSWQIW